MPGADPLSQAVGPFVRFAERMLTAASDEPGGTGGRWLERAALVCLWPEVQPLVAEPTAGVSAGQVRGYAAVVKAAAKPAGWNPFAAAKSELLPLADFLDSLALKLELAETTGLANRLDAAIREWSTSPPVSRLLQLHRTLRAFPAVSGWLDAARGDTAVSLDLRDDVPIEVRAALQVGGRVAKQVTTRTSDPAILAGVRAWSVEWFAHFQVPARLDEKLELEHDFTPSDATVSPDLLLQWLDAASNPSVREALRDYASSLGFSVLSTEHATAVRVFADTPAGERVRIARHGLGRGDEVIRAPVVEVSLGPAPAGYEALLKVSESLPPAGQMLAQRVARLQDAIVGDYLREAGIELFVEFWAEPGRTLHAADPVAASRFADALGHFLDGTFGLTPFTPVTLHDHPDGWVTTTGGGRMMIGLVRRLHRPGLRDAHGNLCIPAVAEVD